MGGRGGSKRAAVGGAEDAAGARLTRAIERFEGTWCKRAGVLPSPQGPVFPQGEVQAPPDVSGMTAELSAMEAQPAAPSITPPTPVAAPDGRLPGFTNPRKGERLARSGTSGTLAYGGALAPGIGKSAGEFDDRMPFQSGLFGNLTHRAATGRPAPMPAGYGTPESRIAANRQLGKLAPYTMLAAACGLAGTAAKLVPKLWGAVPAVTAALPRVPLAVTSAGNLLD